MEQTKKCGDCYWYSNVCVECCEHEHDPTTYDSPACKYFEE